TSSRASWVLPLIECQNWIWILPLSPVEALPEEPEPLVEQPAKAASIKVPNAKAAILLPSFIFMGFILLTVIFSSVYPHRHYAGVAKLFDSALGHAFLQPLLAEEDQQQRGQG